MLRRCVPASLLAFSFVQSNAATSVLDFQPGPTESSAPRVTLDRLNQVGEEKNAAISCNNAAWKHGKHQVMTTGHGSCSTFVAVQSAWLVHHQHRHGSLSCHLCQMPQRQPYEAASGNPPVFSANSCPCTLSRNLLPTAHVQSPGRPYAADAGGRPPCGRLVLIWHAATDAYAKP
jgi:hypothetical protein